MAQGTFEGGVVSIRGDASQVKNELLEVSKLLTELEKNKVKLKPEIDINNVKKDVNKLEQYMQGRFGALDFSQVYSKLMTQAQKNPNKFVEELAKTMRGVNLLEQAVKPEDISKLVAASAQEMFDLVQRLGGLAEGTKPTSNLVTKRLKKIYDKYPNGIEGLNGSGKGGGFGASEEALNKIGDTLGRIDKNVQSISESILNGTNALRTASQGAEEFAGDIEKAEKATDKLTQKQQDLRNAIRNETVNTDWDWTLQYLNGADSKGKPSISKKTEKPKSTSQKPKEQNNDSQPNVSTPAPNVKPIRDVVRAENDLQVAVEGATDALREQNNEINNQGQEKPQSEKDYGFSEINKKIKPPKEIKDYLKSPKYIARNLKGFENDVIQNLDWETLIENIENEALANIKGNTKEEKIDRANGYVDGKKVSEPIDIYAKLKQAVAFVQQIQAMYPPEEADRLLSSFSILQDRVNNDWYEDIGDLFFNETTPDVDVWDMLIEKMHEWAIQYNEKAATLHEGLSQAEIESREVEKEARQEIMKGFTKEDVENANLGAKGTPALYDAKITETQDRLSKMSELKALLEQEKEQGKELSQIENDFLKNYSTYEANANQIISTANERKAVLENPDLVRQANEEKRRQTEEANKVTFSQDVMEAAHAQEELAKSVRETNSALAEQSKVTEEDKNNIMYHIGMLPSNGKRTHPFGQEMLQRTGLETQGRMWGAGTGLYLTRKRSDIASDDVTNKNFYAINTSGLKMFRPETEETATDFHNFIHKLEQFCIGMAAGVTEFDSVLDTTDNDQLYADFQKIFPEYQLTFDQFNTFIDNMLTLVSESGLGSSGIESPVRLDAFRKQFGSDDIKTRFMKMLGFDGIDFSGTSYDDSIVGNIIFDNVDESRIVAQGKNIDEVATQAEKIKKIRQETAEVLKGSDLEEENGDIILNLSEDDIDNSTEAQIKRLDQYIESLQERITWLKERQAELKNLIENNNPFLTDVDKNTLNDIEKTIPKKEARLQKYIAQRNKLVNPSIDESKEAVDETKRNAEEAKKNADNAQKSAEAGKKAVEEAKDNKEKADAVIPTSESVPDLQSTIENAEQANTETEKQVMYVERSFDTLNNYLRQYTQELAQKKQERDTLLQEIQSLQNGTFDTSKMMPGASTTFDSAIEASGQSKKDYLRGMLEYDTQQLDVIEQQIINKQAQVLRVNKEHAEVEELVKQGFDVQEKQKPVKKNKKGVIITQVKDEIKAEQNDIEEAKQIIEEERQEAERLAAEKKAKDEVLQQMINDAGGSTKGHSKSSEFNFGAKLEGGETARQRQQKGGATIKGGNLPNYSTPGTRGGNGNTGVSGSAQQVKVVYQVETTLEDVKDANKQLKALKKTNTELTTSANQAADAIQKEAEALSKMAETLTTIGEIGSKVAIVNQEVKNVTTKAVNQTLTPEQPQASTKPVARPSVKPKATAIKTSDEIKKTKEQIEQLQKAKDDAEQNLKKIILDDSLFDVGDKYQKRNAYTQVKQWADNLKKAQEEVNNLGKNADPQKMQEVLDNYDKMRVGFSKAFEKALNIGTPQNVEKQMEAFEEQYFNLGRPSDDFKQVEERFTQASTQTAERAKAQFEQQKQQAEVIMARLQARLEELQAKEKTEPATQTKPQSGAKPSVDKPDLGSDQSANGMHTEGDEAGDAAAKMKTLADAKKQVTEANQKLSQSAQQTTDSLNGEAGAGTNTSEALQQEIDTAVAHLTETERLFWDARLKNINNPYDIYRLNTDVYSQENLPKDYSKSTEAQVEGLKKRQMQIAEFTSTLISEAEKQEAAFEKINTVYKTATNDPDQSRKNFVNNSFVDKKQTQEYVHAVDEVSQSLQRMREIVQSMKDGTFDFGNIDALRELFELRQNLSNQMSTVKDADKAYKKAQGDIEADSIKQVEQYKIVLNGLQKQIEGIQKDSKKLINPDNDYKSRLTEAKTLLETIQNIINNLNKNPLQFIGEDGQRNARNTQAFIDESKQLVDEFQEDYNSQKGIQGRINTYFTSYKGAYTSFFREIKDSFKSQALGELQNEIDRTFKTFEDSITNLNRATGLNQGEFLDKYLNTNGGKATASQIEQQQKVKNAIAENYRGLITDMSNELSKVQDRMSNIFGENFLKGDFLVNFRDNFTAGLGNADEFSKFQNNAQKAKDSFIELQKIQKQMADGKLDLTQLAPDQLKDKIQEIVKLFADLNENYKKVTDNAKDFTFADIGDIEKQRAGITQFLKSNRGISSEARAYLQDYFNQLQQGISQADLTKLTDGWHQVADAEQAAGRTGATFMSELQTRFRSLSAYLLSFVSFYRVIGVFKDGINIIHELDDALTEMQKVSDESLNSLKEYQKGTFDTANQIGTTASQLQQSTADWLRLGKLNCLFI